MKWFDGLKFLTVKCKFFYMNSTSKMLQRAPLRNYMINKTYCVYKTPWMSQKCSFSYDFGLNYGFNPKK